MNRRTVIIALIVVALFGWIAWANFTSDASAAGPAMGPQATRSASTDTMTESELYTLLRDNSGKIDHLVFEGGVVTVYRTDSKTKFNVNVPDESERTELKSLAREKSVSFDTKPEPQPSMGGAIVMMLVQLALPILLIVGIIWFMTKRQAGAGGAGAMAFGQHKARKHQNVSQAELIRFTDVVGAEEAKTELQEVVDFLKFPDKYKKLGAKIPRGVLLIGPPGTGKTLMARAVAGEAGVPFFSISGSEFVEMFVGVGASRVRSLFDQARLNAPCIVFVDEIDAVGRSRGGGGGMGGAHDEREQTLNQILVEMDGFDNKFGANVIVIAATNRVDVLDPALLRPGRFTRQVMMDLPDYDGRLSTLHLYGDPKPHDPGLDWDYFARATTGMSQADLSNVWNEAAILAARDGSGVISAHHLDTAISKQQFGIERRSMKLTEEHRENVGIHELGHAVAHWVKSKGETPRKITIVPTSKAAGYVQILLKANQMNHTRDECITHIVMALAGRTAQEKLLGKSDTGASNDFEQAWSLAYRMVAEWGWSKLGVIHAPMGENPYTQDRTTPWLRQRIEQEVLDLIAKCQAEADQIVLDYADAIREVTGILLERETILGPEFVEIMSAHRPLETAE